MSYRMAVLRDVSRERTSQDQKWGEQNHTLLYWLGILGEEYGEVCKAVIEHLSVDDVREELVQVAAVAVAAIEYIDRQRRKDAT